MKPVSYEISDYYPILYRIHGTAVAGLARPIKSVKQR